MGLRNSIRGFVRTEHCASSSYLGPKSNPIRTLSSRYQDRKSTRLNSSHANISYAVFCLKKKKTVAPTVNLTVLLHKLFTFPALARTGRGATLLLDLYMRVLAVACLVVL